MRTTSACNSSYVWYILLHHHVLVYHRILIDQKRQFLALWDDNFCQKIIFGIPIVVYSISGERTDRAEKNRVDNLVFSLV